MAWYEDSLRHSKAAQGIKTGRKDRSHPKLAFREAGAMAAQGGPRYIPFWSGSVHPSQFLSPFDVGVKIKNNRDVAEAFAKGATSGRREHLFIEGDVIYSYGYHFPIAVKVKDSATGNIVMLLNKNRYSVTTAKHKSQVRGALASRGWETVEMTTGELKELLAGPRGP